LWNINFLLPDVGQEQRELPQYTADVVSRLSEASKLVRQHLQAAFESSSKWYNHRNKPWSFQPGDHVRVYYPHRYTGRSPKWQKYYSTEGVVVKRLNDVTYVVSSKNWKTNKVTHVDKLKSVNVFPPVKCDVIDVPYVCC